MAAKPLTTEEKNYLRSVYLTSIIGTNAVRTHFDFLHPPANLVTHLANDKSELEWLKEDGFISSKEWEKLFPRSGATCTSAEFDITTLICLLREMTPKVPAPRHTGFDQLPDRADKSTGACLAIIKWYRNFLAHPHQVKLKTLSGDTFKVLFEKVGMAIKVLGNNQYCSKVEKARQLNIDNDFAEILEKFVTHEKQLEDINASVEQNRKQINHLQTLCKENRDKSDEHENEIRTLETSLSEFDKDISDIKSKLKLDREAIEKKVIDLSKQLAEFKTQTNATLALHGENIQNLEQKLDDNIKELSEQQQDCDSLTEGLANTAKQVDELKDVHGKEIKDLQVNQQSLTEGLANTAKQVDELKDVHGKEIKDLQVNQQNERKRNLIDQTESRIRKFMEDTKETFVETKTQKKVLKILERDNCLVMISKGGRGKTALGLQLASFFKNKEFTPMYVVNNEIETMRDIIDFKSKNFIIVDDLFGQTNSNINDHILRVIYDSVKSENCQSKVILNIRESPGCNKSILESHSILRETQVINLDDKTYDLSRQEKKKILLKYMTKLNVSLCDCKEQNMCEERVYTDAVDLSLTVCKSTVEEIIECQTLEGFPEACHMFCSDKTLTVLGLLYFKNTREQLVTTMKNLCAEGFDEIQKKYHYSTLVYVALKGNIDLGDLDENVFLRILSFYEQKDKKIRKTLISKAVDDMSLNGKYLVKGREDDAYVFQHATIYEAVLVSYGEECPEDLLSSCSASFFQEYIRPESFRKLKKKYHVYLFVSDELLSNILYLLFVKETKFKSAFSGISKKLSELQIDSKMHPTETENSHWFSYNEKYMNKDQQMNQDNVDPGYDTYFVDCSLNSMHHRMIGQYLYDMGVRNKLDSFVNMFLSKLSSCYLVTENINPDLMKFFFDGLTFHGERSEAVSRYLDFCKKHLFKYGSYAVILSFFKPSSNADKCNWTFVPVDDELLVKKLIEIFFKTWNFTRNEEEEEEEVFLKHKCEHMIMECLNQPQSNINILDFKDRFQIIGEYLYSMMKKDSDFVKLILCQLIYITNRYYVGPLMMMYLLDGFTDYGKHFDVISANYDFCKECLFKYGSTPVVLSLCRPSSYEGSDQLIEIDNQLLANKLIENLKYTCEDFEEFDYKYPLSINSYHRPCLSNIRYYFFEDTDYYKRTYLEDIASYIFSYGVLENDEEFIQTVITAIHNFEDIKKEDWDDVLSEQMYGPSVPMELCRDRLEHLCESFSTRNIRKMKRRFPCLLKSFSITYSENDDSTSDSDETSEVINP